MQAHSNESDEVPGFDLTALAARLLLTGMPVQSIIAKEAGVSQSTVSRAVHGLIRGQSRGTRRLWIYAAARMADLEVAPPAADATPVRGEPRGAEVRSRARRLPHRRADAHASVQGGDRKSLETAAINGLRRYLDDAFDPQLIIEQLAVLRRAQDRGARAQPED